MASLLVQWERIHLPMQETQETGLRYLSREDPMQEGMATYSVFLLGESHGTEKPGGLQTMGSQRVGYN